MNPSQRSSRSCCFSSGAPSSKRSSEPLAVQSALLPRLISQARHLRRICSPWRRALEENHEVTICDFKGRRGHPKSLWWADTALQPLSPGRSGGRRGERGRGSEGPRRRTSLQPPDPVGVDPPPLLNFAFLTPTPCPTTSSSSATPATSIRRRGRTRLRFQSPAGQERRLRALSYARHRATGWSGPGARHLSGDAGRWARRRWWRGVFGVQSVSAIAERRPWTDSGRGGGDRRGRFAPARRCAGRSFAVRASRRGKRELRSASTQVAVERALGGAAPRAAAGAGRVDLGDPEAVAWVEVEPGKVHLFHEKARGLGRAAGRRRGAGGRPGLRRLRFGGGEPLDAEAGRGARLPLLQPGRHGPPARRAQGDEGGRRPGGEATATPRASTRSDLSAGGRRSCGRKTRGQSVRGRSCSSGSDGARRGGRRAAAAAPPARHRHRRCAIGQVSSQTLAEPRR